MGLELLSSRAVRGMFFNRLEQNPGLAWIAAISAYFTSDQAKEEYPWLGQTPTMRKFGSGRQPSGLSANALTIANEHFEASLEIPVKDMRRDKTGQIKVRISEFADRTTTHWAQLLSALISSGESSVCYDGSYFFDTDHAEGKSGQQSNRIEVDISELPCTLHGSPALPTPEEMRQAILKGLTQLYTLKDDQGEPMNEGAREWLVMVPTPFWDVTKTALAQPLVAGGQTNIIQVLDEVVIKMAQNPRLSWPNKFGIFRTDAATKPLIRQEEVEIDLKSLAEGSEYETLHAKHLHAVDTSRGVGFGYWQQGCLVELK
jgi:phage major head subunit gpT-like protein